MLSRNQYVLKTDGDSYEQMFGATLEGFPNYEKLWSLFVVPWTNRDLLPRTDQRWIHSRSNVPPGIEEFTMAHYSVFRDLIYYSVEKKRYGFESLRTIYTHFGHAVEMATLVACKILLLKEELGLLSLPVFQKKKPEELATDFTKFSSSDYSARFEELKDKQIPILWTVQGTRPILRSIISNSKDQKKIMGYFQSVQEYRNKFIHSPLPGMIGILKPDGQQIQYAIKKDRIAKYRLWTDVTHKFSDNQDDFVPEVDLVDREFRDLKENLNTLWNYFIAEIEAMCKTKKLLVLHSKTTVPA